MINMTILSHITIQKRVYGYILGGLYSIDLLQMY